MSQHGTNPATRMRLLRERVLAIKQLWANDIASYHGEFVNIAPTTVRPAPLQKPHPPIIVGGKGTKVPDHVLEFGDAWAPNPGWPPMPDLPDRIVELRTRASAAGRPHIPVLVFGVAAQKDQIERYAAMAADACIFLLPTLPKAETIEALRSIARIAGL
jgi:alkanesulfonate monooxygenase SsuD/methylene tetrahydromethanopterin reductase-like flavin-dependent oxidoreductase (luciferase family)